MKPGICSRIVWTELLGSLAVLAVLLAALPAHAILPPKVYVERAAKSKIKAVAVVQSISEISRTDNARRVELLFRLEKSFSPYATPQAFSGNLWVLLPGRGPRPGDPIYHQPQLHERVFVTISELGGRVTSYTRMTPELEKALKASPQKIKFGIERALIAD